MGPLCARMRRARPSVITDGRTRLKFNELLESVVIIYTQCMVPPIMDTPRNQAPHID